MVDDYPLCPSRDGDDGCLLYAGHLPYAQWHIGPRSVWSEWGEVRRDR